MKPTPDRARAVAALLRAYEERLRRLPDDVDPGWLEAVGLAAGRRRAGAGRHLPEALGLPPASGDDFVPPLHRIAVLPQAASARLLRLRALWRRRRLVRSPDPRLQRRFRDWVGDIAYETLLREGGEGGKHDVDVGLPLAPGGNHGVTRALAWEGYCLFERDGAWRAALPARLLRLGFSPAEDDCLYPGTADPRAARWIAERLPRFVPEAPWLCD